jgi:hypothetical protein
MEISHRVTACMATVMLAISGLPGAAQAAGTKSIAYFGTNTVTYLIDWQPKKRARVVSYDGAGVGGVANDGTRNIVTLDAPISSLVDGLMDDCGNIIQQRKDVTQVTERDLDGGIAEVNEIGTYTNIGGCQDGQVTPFGALDEPGAQLSRLSMAVRPPVTDLVAGTQIAGFSEDLPTPDNPFLGVDVVTLQAGGTALFQSSGHAVPAALDASQWLVFSLPTQQRAYARLLIDNKTGGETWLVADWASGQAQTVRSTLVVKPLAGAGFGSTAQASRMWESGLFAGTRNPFFIYLSKTGTGERVLKDLDLETRAPIAAWGLDGVNLWQQRLLADGSIQRNRTWVPLRNEGSKTRWVIESEVQVDGSDVAVLIKPRVNYYRDTGKAVPPAVQSTGTGMARLDERRTLAR